jgi:hypothetical protein
MRKPFGAFTQLRLAQHVPHDTEKYSQIPPDGIQSWDSGRAEAEACMANAKIRSMGDFKNCIVKRFRLEMKYGTVVAGAAEIRSVWTHIYT